MIITLDTRLVIASLISQGMTLRVTACNFSDPKYTYAGVSIHILIIWAGILLDKWGVMGFNLIGQCLLSWNSNRMVV